MNVIVCLEDGKGMLFHGRRLSRDKYLTEKLYALCAGSRLWMNAYSAKLYAGAGGETIVVDEEFLKKAGEGDFCLVETEALQPYAENIGTLTVFWWNRSYPSDVRLDLDLSDWELAESEEFAGFSHENIKRETYRRKGKNA